MQPGSTLGVGTGAAEVVSLALAEVLTSEVGAVAAAGAGLEVTDEAMALECQGLRPLLVEGREDNFKVTTPADLARFEFELARRP